MFKFLTICLFFLAPFVAHAGEAPYFIDSPCPQHKIEVMVQYPKEHSPEKPKSLMVFLHGAASGKGLQGIAPSWYNHWLDKGYIVAAISMPGFGKSTGNRDFLGPFTIESLDHALNTIKQTTRAKKLGILGFGQGGSAALLLAAKRRDINCVVCSNGGYNLLRHKKDSLFTLLNKKGYHFDTTNDKALKLRSVHCHIAHINAPTYLLHRLGNPIIDEQEVTDFAHAMQQAGKECHILLKEKTPHDHPQKLSYQEVLAATEAFIDNKMGLK